MSMVWASGGVVGDILLAHLRPLVLTEHCLNATAYLSIVPHHVYPFSFLTSSVGAITSFFLSF